MKRITENVQKGILLLLLIVVGACSEDAETVPEEEELVLPFDSGIAINGNFEAGTDGWLFFPNGGATDFDETRSNGEDANSARITTNGISNPGIKQERIGIGVVQAGDTVLVQFDHLGTVAGEGGFFNVLLFVERAEGEAGTPITHIFNPQPILQEEWSTFTATFTIPSTAVVTGGISVLIESVCGGAVGCAVAANVDNLSIMLNP